MSTKRLGSALPIIASLARKHLLYEYQPAFSSWFCRRKSSLPTRNPNRDFDEHRIELITRKFTTIKWQSLTSSRESRTSVVQYTSLRRYSCSVPLLSVVRSLRIALCSGAGAPCLCLFMYVFYISNPRNMHRQLRRHPCKTQYEQHCPNYHVKKAMLTKKTQSIKSAIFILYQYLTKHTARFQRWGSLRAYAILDTLDTLLWFTAFIINCMGGMYHFLGFPIHAHCLSSQKHV